MDTTYTLDHAFTGIWLSEYTYHSTTKDADINAKGYVRVFEKDTTLVIESVPGLMESYCLLRLTKDGDILTGSWQEHTSPHGDYKGAVYYGAIQMVLSDNGKAMSGQWVGFGKRMDIKTGPWKITFAALSVENLVKPL
jgi:hypothetical protein